jgi:hypothetical protein
MSDKKSAVVQPLIRIQLAEYQRSIYLANVEQGVTREQLKDPKFWAHIANQLKPKDQIEVHAEDGSFVATFIVLACERTWAKVHELSYHNLTKSDITDEQRKAILEDYLVEFKGGNKWCVIRKSDNALMQSKLHSKSDAEQWLLVHINQAAAA